MILSSPDQKYNVVVRALIFQGDCLLLSRFVGGVYFPVGGRVEFGETLIDTLHREVLEETGQEVLRYRLVYTHENFFPSGTWQVHEYGWFYRVDLKTSIGFTGAELPHPDHPDLRLAWVPVSSLETVPLFPEFLCSVVPRDWEQHFASPPQHVVSRYENGGPTHSIVDLVGPGPTA